MLLCHMYDDVARYQCQRGFYYALIWVNAAAVLAWRATPVFSCSADTVGRDWHGFASAFPLLLLLASRVQQKRTQLSPKAATPCQSHSLFPLRDAFWTKLKARPLLQLQSHLSFQCDFGETDSKNKSLWDYVTVCPQQAESDCYTSCVGVFISVIGQWNHIAFTSAFEHTVSKFILI